MTPKYNSISEELQERILEDRKNNIENPYAFKDENIIRRNMDHDKANLWRPAFVRDVEKIQHIPYYNRYFDKTQVFSLYKNDDISRRALHVQLVSRIARNIGRVLNLNIDLIEAIALGHDMGHTPFGHAGEDFLSKLYFENTGRYFNHNVHSVRVLDKVIKRNMSLQVLDGILCHNGELTQKEYRPSKLDNFEDFDKKTESCYIDKNNIGYLIPSTLEGCVVRVSDIIAYLGKDRQDAERLKMIEGTKIFTSEGIGSSNAEIINNLSVSIMEHSYGKSYLQMDENAYNALKLGKVENNDIIYGTSKVRNVYNELIEPMMGDIYKKLLKDLEDNNTSSIIYRHHIDYVNKNNWYSEDNEYKYEDSDPNDIVVDYIASMTDDYFIDLHDYLFPNSKYNVEYKGYFENI